MDRSSGDLGRFYEQITRGEVRLAFDKIGFLNIGYWKDVEDSIEIAQIRLIETLLEFFDNKSGSVLDVACGKGVSTKFLTKYFDPKKVTGINISEIQLQVCKAIAPECKFRLMDATQLDFADCSFDNVLCIEAAQHFRTRRKFLEEAYRVLVPGGRLAMHDLIFKDPDRADAPNPEIWPKENYMQDLGDYRGLLRDVGFKYVRVDDVTEHSMTAAMRNLSRAAEREFAIHQDYGVLDEAMQGSDTSNPWMPDNCKWCMAYAVK